MKHTRWRIVVAIGLLSLAAFPQDKPAETGNSVFIIPVVGEINYTQNAFVRRSVLV